MVYTIFGVITFIFAVGNLGLAIFDKDEAAEANAALWLIASLICFKGI